MWDVKCVWLLTLLNVFIPSISSSTITSTQSSSYTSPVDAFYHDRTENTTNPVDAAYSTWTASSRENSNDLIPVLIRHLETLGELAQRACLSLSQDCDRRMNDIRELEARVSQLNDTNQALQTENKQLQNTTQEQETVIEELRREIERLQNLTQRTNIQGNTDQYSRDAIYHLQTLVEKLLRTGHELRSRVDHYQDENTVLHEKIHQLQSESMLRERVLQNQQQRIRELEQGMGHRGPQEEEINAINHISSLESSVPLVRTPWDCTEAMRQGEPNGVHTIFPRGGGGGGVRVWCQRVEGRVWTVILNRNNQSIPQVDFARSWPPYKHGFGDPASEYWIGNDHLHDLTGNNVSYFLRVEATNLKGEIRSGVWRYFRVSSEADRYRVSLSPILPQSELGDALSNMNGASFTTYDRDHDTSMHRNCAARHGGGWWYQGCGLTFPTAPHSPAEGPTNGITRVLNWAYFGPQDSGWVALSHLTMMIASAA